jgi:hypothetical protein
MEVEEGNMTNKQLWIDMQNTSLNGTWSVKSKAEPLPYSLAGPIILALSVLSWTVVIVPIIWLNRA